MAKIGYAPCGMCGNKEGTVNETATGTLSTGCHVCDFSGFAKKGTQAAKMILKNMRPIENDEPLDGDSKGAAPKGQTPKSEPAPVSKKPTSVFNIGSV